MLIRRVDPVHTKAIVLSPSPRLYESRDLKGKKGKGRHARNVSLNDMHACTGGRQHTWLVTMLCVVSTPLGRPVVPLLGSHMVTPDYKTKTIRFLVDKSFAQSRHWSKLSRMYPLETERQVRMNPVLPCVNEHGSLGMRAYVLRRGHHIVALIVPAKGRKSAGA